MWRAVEDALADYTPDRLYGHQNGLQLARIAQGIMGRHNVDPHEIGPHRAQQGVLAALERVQPLLPRLDLTAFMKAEWSGVFAPEGFKPVDWAIKRVGWMRQMEPVVGEFAMPPLATTLWHVFRLLPTNEHGAAAASTRQLGTALNTNRNLIAQALNELCAEGYLVLHTASTTTLSPRYLAQSVPVVFQLVPVVREDANERTLRTISESAPLDTP